MILNLLLALVALILVQAAILYGAKRMHASSLNINLSRANLLWLGASLLASMLLIGVAMHFARAEGIINPIKSNKAALEDMRDSCSMDGCYKIGDFGTDSSGVHTNPDMSGSPDQMRSLKEKRNKCKKRGCYQVGNWNPEDMGNTQITVVVPVGSGGIGIDASNVIVSVAGSPPAPNVTAIVTPVGSGGDLSNVNIFPTAAPGTTIGADGTVSPASPTRRMLGQRSAQAQNTAVPSFMRSSLQSPYQYEVGGSVFVPAQAMEAPKATFKQFYSDFDSCISGCVGQGLSNYDQMQCEDKCNKAARPSYGMA